MGKRRFLQVAAALLVLCGLLAFLWFRPFRKNDNETPLPIRAYVWENREAYGIRRATVYGMDGYVEVLIEPENADYREILRLYLKYGDAIRIRVAPFDLVLTS